MDKSFTAKKITGSTDTWTVFNFAWVEHLQKKMVQCMDVLANMRAYVPMRELDPARAESFETFKDTSSLWKDTDAAFSKLSPDDGTPEAAKAKRMRDYMFQYWFYASRSQRDHVANQIEVASFRFVGRQLSELSKEILDAVGDKVPDTMDLAITKFLSNWKASYTASGTVPDAKTAGSDLLRMVYKQPEKPEILKLVDYDLDFVHKLTLSVKELQNAIDLATIDLTTHTVARLTPSKARTTDKTNAVNAANSALTAHNARCGKLLMESNSSLVGGSKKSKTESARILANIAHHVALSKKLCHDLKNAWGAANTVSSAPECDFGVDFARAAIPPHMMRLIGENANIARPRKLADIVAWVKYATENDRFLGQLLRKRYKITASLSWDTDMDFLSKLHIPTILLCCLSTNWDAQIAKIKSKTLKQMSAFEGVGREFYHLQTQIRVWSLVYTRDFVRLAQTSAAELAKHVTRGNALDYRADMCSHFTHKIPVDQMPKQVETLDIYMKPIFMFLTSIYEDMRLLTQTDATRRTLKWIGLLINAVAVLGNDVLCISWTDFLLALGIADPTKPHAFWATMTGGAINSTSGNSVWADVRVEPENDDKDFEDDSKNYEGELAGEEEYEALRDGKDAVAHLTDDTDINRMLGKLYGLMASAPETAEAIKDADEKRNTITKWLTLAQNVLNKMRKHLAAQTDLTKRDEMRDILKEVKEFVRNTEQLYGTPSTPKDIDMHMERVDRRIKELDNMAQGLQDLFTAANKLQSSLLTAANQEPPANVLFSVMRTFRAHCVIKSGVANVKRILTLCKANTSGAPRDPRSIQTRNDSLSVSFNAYRLPLFRVALMTAVAQTNYHNRLFAIKTNMDASQRLKCANQVVDSVCAAFAAYKDSESDATLALEFPKAVTDLRGLWTAASTLQLQAQSKLGERKHIEIGPQEQPDEDAQYAVDLDQVCKDIGVDSAPAQPADMAETTENADAIVAQFLLRAYSHKDFVPHYKEKANAPSEAYLNQLRHAITVVCKKVAENELGAAQMPEVCGATETHDSKRHAAAFWKARLLFDYISYRFEPTALEAVDISDNDTRNADVVLKNMVLNAIQRLPSTLATSEQFSIGMSNKPSTIYFAYSYMLALRARVAQDSIACDDLEAVRFNVIRLASMTPNVTWNSLYKDAELDECERPDADNRLRDCLVRDTEFLESVMNEMQKLDRQFFELIDGMLPAFTARGINLQANSKPTIIKDLIFVFKQKVDNAANDTKWLSDMLNNRLACATLASECKKAAQALNQLLLTKDWRGPRVQTEWGKAKTVGSSWETFYVHEGRMEKLAEFLTALAAVRIDNLNKEQKDVRFDYFIASCTAEELSTAIESASQRRSAATLAYEAALAASSAAEKKHNAEPQVAEALTEDETQLDHLYTELLARKSTLKDAKAQLSAYDDEHTHPAADNEEENDVSEDVPENRPGLSEAVDQAEAAVTEATKSYTDCAEAIVTAANTAKESAQKEQTEAGTAQGRADDSVRELRRQSNETGDLDGSLAERIREASKLLEATNVTFQQRDTLWRAAVARSDANPNADAVKKRVLEKATKLRRADDDLKTARDAEKETLALLQSAMNDVVSEQQELEIKKEAAAKREKDCNVPESLEAFQEYKNNLRENVCAFDALLDSVDNIDASLYNAEHRENLNSNWDTAFNAFAAARPLFGVSTELPVLNHAKVLQAIGPTGIDGEATGDDDSENKNSDDQFVYDEMVFFFGAAAANLMGFNGIQGTPSEKQPAPTFGVHDIEKQPSAYASVYAILFGEHVSTLRAIKHLASEANYATPAQRKAMDYWRCRIARDLFLMRKVAVTEPDQPSDTELEALKKELLREPAAAWDANIQDANIPMANFLFKMATRMAALYLQAKADAGAAAQVDAEAHRKAAALDANSTLSPGPSARPSRRARVVFDEEEDEKGDSEKEQKTAQKEDTLDANAIRAAAAVAGQNLFKAQRKADELFRLAGELRAQTREILRAEYNTGTGTASHRRAFANTDDAQYGVEDTDFRKARCLVAPDIFVNDMRAYGGVHVEIVYHYHKTDAPALALNMFQELQKWLTAAGLQEGKHYHRLDSDPGDFDFSADDAENDFIDSFAKYGVLLHNLRNSEFVDSATNLYWEQFIMLTCFYKVFRHDTDGVDAITADDTQDAKDEFAAALKNVTTDAPLIKPDTFMGRGTNTEAEAKNNMYRAWLVYRAGVLPTLAKYNKRQPLVMRKPVATVAAAVDDAKNSLEVDAVLLAMEAVRAYRREPRYHRIHFRDTFQRYNDIAVNDKFPIETMTASAALRVVSEAVKNAHVSSMESAISYWKHREEENFSDTLEDIGSMMDVLRHAREDICSGRGFHQKAVMRSHITDRGQAAATDPSLLALASMDEWRASILNLQTLWDEYRRDVYVQFAGVLVSELENFAQSILDDDTTSDDRESFATSSLEWLAILETCVAGVRVETTLQTACNVAALKACVVAKKLAVSVIANLKAKLDKVLQQPQEQAQPPPPQQEQDQPPQQPQPQQQEQAPKPIQIGSKLAELLALTKKAPRSAQAGNGRAQEEEKLPAADDPAGAVPKKSDEEEEAEEEEEEDEEEEEEEEEDIISLEVGLVRTVASLADTFRKGNADPAEAFANALRGIVTIDGRYDVFHSYVGRVGSTSQPVFEFARCYGVMLAIRPVLRANRLSFAVFQNLVANISEYAWDPKRATAAVRLRTTHDTSCEQLAEAQKECAPWKTVVAVRTWIDQLLAASTSERHTQKTQWFLIAAAVAREWAVLLSTELLQTPFLIADAASFKTIQAYHVEVGNIQIPVATGDTKDKYKGNSARQLAHKLHEAWQQIKDETNDQDNAYAFNLADLENATATATVDEAIRQQTLAASKKELLRKASVYATKPPARGRGKNQISEGKTAEDIRKAAENVIADADPTTPRQPINSKRKPSALDVNDSSTLQELKGKVVTIEGYKQAFSKKLAANAAAVKKTQLYKNERESLLFNFDSITKLLGAIKANDDASRDDIRETAQIRTYFLKKINALWDYGYDTGDRNTDYQRIHPREPDKDDKKKKDERKEKKKSDVDRTEGDPPLPDKEENPLPPLPGGEENHMPPPDQDNDG
jgi:hypothetical protein